MVSSKKVIYNTSMTTNTSVRVRIAPSPTGEDIHIGNLYTALLNYVFAKKNKGTFIVRVEDTDRERLVVGSEQKILSTLRAYGLNYDEGPDTEGEFGPYRQSDRLGIYKQYAQKLVASGHAYYCFCTKERLDALRAEKQKKGEIAKYDKHCLTQVTNAAERIANGEDYVIRLDVPGNKQITFTDVIRGKITFNSNDIDDQVLLKSDGFPTYHLAVVVDDHLMKISHVIRAEDWIPSTPKHILLFEAFGWDLPIFVHVPLLRNPDRSKLSKRKNPVWAGWYLEQGYLTEAVLNFLALLGWSHPQEKEIFSLEEFTKLFSLEDIHAVGPIFDITKLTWMNQQYIQNMPDQKLLDQLLAFDPGLKKVDRGILTEIIPLVKTRMNTLLEFGQLTKHFFTEPEIKAETEQEKEIVAFLQTEFSKLSQWNKDAIFSVFKKAMERYSIRMGVLYKLLTGNEKGLPLPESFEILGKNTVVQRLKTIYGN